jgi:MoaA/NifB/PqqE/SkfB family radical SAM enzyme
MPVETACRAIDEIASAGLSSRIAYHLMGEPLLHPALGAILTHARSRGLSNRVVTNGFWLGSEKQVDKLTACDTLDISLRAWNEETFSQLSGAGTYDVYLRGIRDFLAIRKAKGITLTRIRMFRSPELATLLTFLGIDVPGSELEQSGRSEFRANDDLALFIEPLQDWSGEKKKFPTCHFGYCDEFFTGFSVLVNGDITTCCWDYDGANKLGNFLTDGGLVAVLGNDKADRFRQAFKKRKIPTPYCAACLGRSTRARSFAYQALSLLRLRNSR